MSLEELPNEILLQVFSLLELTQLHRAFSSLNFRLDCLLADRSLDFTARWDSTSSVASLTDFYPRLRRLMLSDWQPEAVFSLLDPSTFPLLKDLCVRSSANGYFGLRSAELVQRILSFPAVHRLQLHLAPTLHLTCRDLPRCTALESLSLSMIALNHLLHLLRHLPRLRSLSLSLNANGRRTNEQDSLADDRFECLTSLTLLLHNDIHWSDLLLLLGAMPQLKRLTISGSMWDQEFLSAPRWQEILVGLPPLPSLDRLKADLQVRRINNGTNPLLICQDFHTDFFSRSRFRIRFDRKYWFNIRI